MITTGDNEQPTNPPTPKDKPKDNSNECLAAKKIVVDNPDRRLWNTKK